VRATKAATGFPTIPGLVFLQVGMSCSQRQRGNALHPRDPRLSLEEHHGNEEGYVAARRIAAEKAVRGRFLLTEDADRQAIASNVLR
jgi:hypothetical protein